MTQERGADREGAARPPEARKAAATGAASAEPAGAEVPGAAPHVGRARWRLVGPGIVVAATGVGAGDLVATLVAGSRFGYTLLWAAVIGCLVKISLAEAVGRWHLATGRTLLEGWRSLGAWTTGYFAVYVTVWGFVYGATAMSAAALPLAALFPGVLDLKAWAVGCGLLGLVFVWCNRYAVVERTMTVLVGVMFVVVVTVAVRTAPRATEAFAGLVPAMPDGSLLYTLGLIGGVGGTITVAAYGYWVNAKGWTGSGWMRAMRLDNRVAYATTGVFVVAMLVIGAELLHASQTALASGGHGLVDLGEVLRERFGPHTARLFLIGFFAASFSSLVGVWHGVSLLFADFTAGVRAARRPDSAVRGAADAVARGERERSLPFRGYLLWLTVPPMPLLWLDQPFGLVIAYGVVGACFLPFLALTLLWLLNTARTPPQWRNGLLGNATLALSGALFLALCVEQIRGLPW